MNAPARHRGLTLLEVVLASTLLAVLASVVLGSITFIERVQVRDIHRLNGTEVAHRILAQYIDDPRELPPEDMDIQQGDFLYRYVLRDDILEFQGEEGAVYVDAVSVPARNVPAMQQFGSLSHSLIVEVYISDPRVPDSQKRTAVASLRRLYSPVLREEDALMDWINALLERIREEKRETRQRNRNGGN